MNSLRIPDGIEQVKRDYTNKAIEYENVSIPEYWIVDTIEQKITILLFQDGNYTKTIFTEGDTISSLTFSQLRLTANEILEA